MEFQLIDKDAEITQLPEDMATEIATYEDQPSALANFLNKGKQVNEASPRHSNR